MTTYVALLRGIGPSNPNMRNEKLRSVFEKLGFTKVQSVISSGNIIFQSTKTGISTLEKQIEQALTQQLGFNSAVIIRSQEQLESLVAQDYFGALEHGPKTYLTVTFLRHRPPKDFKLPPNDFGIIKVDPDLGVICASLNTVSSKTPDFMAWIERQIGKGITTRTWNTVQKILKKCQL